MIRKHPYLFAFALVSALCLALVPAFFAFGTFAEAFSRTVGAASRLMLGGLSSLFPFSLFEILIALYVLYLASLLILIPLSFSRKKHGKKPLRIGTMLLAAGIVLLTVADLFALTFASCYHREPLSSHMALDTESVGEEELFLALEGLVNVVNESAPHLEKNQKGESLSPDFSEVKKAINDAADSFAQTNAFLQPKGYTVKTFVSSPLMTYTHISGMFGFFTGEANVNTHYPHFIVTASAAHESCHARGIAPENECNFLAAVILMESGDEYLAYCGAAFLLSDVIAAARKSDKARAEATLSSLDPVLWRDYAAYRVFFEPYRDSTAAKIADAGNDAYLKAQGQKEGTVSYGRVLRLTGAYFAKQVLEKSTAIG